MGMFCFVLNPPQNIPPRFLNSLLPETFFKSHSNVHNTDASLVSPQSEKRRLWLKKRSVPTQGEKNSYDSLSRQICGSARSEGYRAARCTSGGELRSYSKYGTQPNFSPLFCPLLCLAFALPCLPRRWLARSFAVFFSAQSNYQQLRCQRLTADEMVPWTAHPATSRWILGSRFSVAQYEWDKDGLSYCLFALKTQLKSTP